ncbi:MAG TPA: response regulator [Chloroflexota bacterium]|nr:response regulator [Chloroflexota bacterium]
MSRPDAKTVLVVDDEQDILDLVAITLEDEGFSVNTASNGLEALDAVKRQMPDLILLDMKMPVMDASEFAREFHLRYGYSTPILMLTAMDDVGSRAKLLGAIGWIGKPFDLDDLAASVKRINREEQDHRP